MADQFYSGMRGTYAVSKLNELWNTVDESLNTGTALDAASGAASSAVLANLSAQAASGSASGAASSAVVAGEYLDSIINVFSSLDQKYLGAFPIDPVVDNQGNPILPGAVYYNTTDNILKFYNGTAWEEPSAAAAQSAIEALASAQAASASASGAVLSAQAASGSASGAVVSAQAASGSATNALNSYKDFNRIYLGSFSTPPITDNEGNALQIGSLYWNNDVNTLYLWDGQVWNAAAFSISGSVISFNARTGVVTLSYDDVINALGFIPYSSSNLDNDTIISTDGIISLNNDYGDLLNPYGQKTANYILAAPSEGNGVPLFRALTSLDIPTLNQDTTGSAARWASPITLSLTGEISGSASFDGSSNIDLNTTIAVNIDYNSLTNKPTLFSGSYTDLTDKPILFSGDYVDLINTPTIPDITGKLDLSGGTMTGSLILSSDPAAALEAATKQYVDSAIASVNINSIGDISDVTLTSLQTGQILKYNGVEWINEAFTPGDILPDQTNNAGKFLTTDGITASWDNIFAYSSGTVSYQKEVFFSTEGQTEFLVEYTIGYLDLYLNGIKLIDTQDYSATNGTSINITIPLKENDVIEVVKWQNIPNAAYTRYLYTASIGQTEFIAQYFIGTVDVYLNGNKLIESIQFIATNGTSITVPTAIENDIIEIIAWQNIIPTNSANLVLPSQVGNSGYLLSTNGINASWIPYPTVFSGDYNDLINQPTIPSSINDLNDVNITSINNNQLLKYNGTNWINITAPIGDLVGTSDIQTLSNKTIASYTESVYALSGTNINPSNGPIQTITLSSATTFTESLSSGQTVTLMIENADVYSITWPTATWVTAQGNVEPTYTSKDVFIIWKINTTLYLSYAGSYA